MAKKPQPTTELTIGLDVGYGFTKALEASGNSVMFPSVAAHASEIKFRADDIAAKYPGDQITDEDGEWFIGDLAQSQAPNQLLTLRGLAADENATGNTFRTRLAKVALGKLLPDQRNGDAIHVRIATGLPVEHMRDAAALKSVLIGQHEISTDLTHFIANVTQVMVMPQPYGTIYANTLTPAGEINPCHTAIRTGVVDIGTFTLDLTLDDNGEYIDTESATRESGVFTAQERIRKALKRDFNYTASQKVIESTLRTGCVRVSGDVQRYDDEVAAALEPLRSATLDLIGATWRQGKNVDVIYVSGGGAALVIDSIKGSYKQAQLVDNAQLANARGYLNYARFAERE